MPLKIFISCLLLLLVGKKSNDETITWNASRKLCWADFKAEPNPDADTVALTASGITFGYSVKTSGRRIISFSTTVEAQFYPNKSWYLKEKGDARILRHEQLHFDITELYARKFRQQLSLLVANRKIKVQLNKLHTEIDSALNKTQARYDKESDHSINAKVQNEWEHYVAEELKALDEFKSQ